jgi:uncharacterized protein (DUF342 family)
MLSNLREITGNVTAQMQNIEHDGPLVVSGNIESGSFIVATGDIVIKGEANNAKIKSIKGHIHIENGIKGVSSIVYSGGGNIQTKSVYNATLKAENSVIIREAAIDAHIIAKKSVFIEQGEGLIEGGEVEAGIDIVANTIGNHKKTVTIVKISDFKQRELFFQIMRYDKELEALSKEIENVEKFIEVIKILGKKVVTLPMEKKQDLALKVQKYNELKSKYNEILSKKEELSEASKQENELERTIIAHKNLYEGVNVYMDKAKLVIKGRYSNVILYRRGIIIIGDYDKFMHRKKYAY